MCSICGRYDGMHDYRCPYYSPLRPKYLCCYCGEGIYQGEPINKKNNFTNTPKKKSLIKSYAKMIESNFNKKDIQKIIDELVIYCQK